MDPVFKKNIVYFLRGSEPFKGEGLTPPPTPLEPPTTEIQRKCVYLSSYFASIRRCTKQNAVRVSRVSDDERIITQFVYREYQTMYEA